MKHIKKLDIQMDDNMDADDLGSRISTIARKGNPSSAFANLVRVRFSDNMKMGAVSSLTKQISDAFHRVGVTNCVVVPVFDNSAIEGIDVTEVVTNLEDRVAFNDSKMHPSDEFICSNCGLILRENCRYEIDEDADGDETCYEFEIKYCPRCGRKIIEET